MKLAVLVVALAATAAAQNFSQRGFIEFGAQLYPDTAVNDSSHAIGEARFRYEAFYKPTPNLRFAGAVDGATDTHLEAEREWGLSWWDRERRRPALEVHRLSAGYTRGKLTVEAGKQLIRWGKTDVLNPTDRFAPRDYLNVVDTDFLPITAARVTYGGQSDTVEAVFSPRLTPSRVPLLNQRWAVLPTGIPITEQAPDFPGGPQFGVRWNHIGRVAEYALSLYNGFDNQPLYAGSGSLAGVFIRRYYPQMRMYGADAAVPLPLVTLKAEAAYFTSSTPQSDEYALYVLQLERQTGEWTFAGGYAGQAVTAHGTGLAYSPTRGLTRAFVAHAGYTIDTRRSVAFEAVVRQNGRAVYLKPEYTQAFGQHWRVTAGFALIRGSDNDFLGQYHRNSHGILSLRYSF